MNISRWKNFLSIASKKRGKLLGNRIQFDFFGSLFQKKSNWDVLEIQPTMNKSKVQSAYLNQMNELKGESQGQSTNALSNKYTEAYESLIQEISGLQGSNQAPPTNSGATQKSVDNTEESKKMSNKPIQSENSKTPILEQNLQTRIIENKIASINLINLKSQPTSSFFVKPNQRQNETQSNLILNEAPILEKEEEKEKKQELNLVFKKEESLPKPTVDRSWDDIQSKVKFSYEDYQNATNSKQQNFQSQNPQFTLQELNIINKEGNRSIITWIIIGLCVLIDPQFFRKFYQQKVEELATQVDENQSDHQPKINNHQSEIRNHQPDVKLQKPELIMHQPELVMNQPQVKIGQAEMKNILAQVQIEENNILQSRGQ